MTVEHRTDDTPRPTADAPGDAVTGAGAAPGVVCPAHGHGGLDRRRLLSGAAVVGVAGVTLAACGTGDEGSSAQGSDGGDSGGDGQGGSDGGSGGGSGGGTTVPTSELPVGGGRVLKQEKVVVTQPAQGEFAAFTAVCTHQGCLVNSVEDGTISCPCHGSRFSAEDGSVTGGPAPRPLDPVQISVSGGEITLA
jgi:Rieske Fe-S protein